MRKTTHIIIYFILLLSLSANILCILPYKEIIKEKFDRKFNKEAHTYWEENTPDSIFINSVKDKAMKMDGKAYTVEEYVGLFEDIKNMFRDRESYKVKNDFNISYCYAGLSYYALERKDPIVLNYLQKLSKSITKNNVDELNYDITQIVQIPIGIMFINLYKATGIIKYKNVAISIFNKLKEFREDGNIIPYFKNSNYRFVDGVGMYVPFLMEYFELTQDSLAREIALDNMNDFRKNCTDKETGIPHHGYDPKTKMKLGSANWGRGIGWFLLAAAYCNKEYKDSLLQHNIGKMPYQQFPLQIGSNFDSSTAIMFEIYKQSQDSLRVPQLLDIKTRTTHVGIIDHCSGDTHNYNDYSHTFGAGEMCNGFLLILISKFDNVNNYYTNK